jgi:aspartyl-tRNA(Asn)/glutamyl-tRNA(Gln) amidotransferase subunit B
MEEGSLRCDANVSVRLRGQADLGTKTEVKNMNSFRHVEQAIQYEIDRQIRVLEQGDKVVQETRLWDADQSETRPMRSKEEAHDYRYFPDPDLVPVVVTDELLKQVRAALPEMPEVRQKRFVEEYGLPLYDASILTEERALADYYEKAVGSLYKKTKGGDTQAQAKAVSNFVMGDVLRVVNERNLDVASFPVQPKRLADLVYLRLDDTVSSSAAQDLFDAMLEDERPPKAIAKDRNLMQVSDKSAILPVVDKVLTENKKQVKTYLNGKKGLLGYFIGQVMKQFDGSPDPKLVRDLLREKLNAMRD